MGLRLECKTRRFVTDETQELHFRIEIQNKVYKREVAALDKEIGRLEKLLAEPLDSASGSNASLSLHKRVSVILVSSQNYFLSLLGFKVIFKYQLYKIICL